ncbi:MAG: hypothetical protein FJ271_13745 [Planctomycetes bacterium]|nr:hypothetical protein [Planctomycetota bacterium]
MGEQTEFFLFRRTQEACPNWVIVLPVAFAFAVVLLIVLFKRERRVPTFLWSSAVIGVLSAVYLALPLVLKGLLPGWTLSWWYILIPFLAVGLVYVWLMYLRDAQSIHPVWAAFLGILRCSVYAILAFVFLLPGCQHYDISETFSKTLFLLDVSGSMGTIDDLPEPGQDPAKLPTRQDKVIQFLTSIAQKGDDKTKSFIERIVQKSPVTAYRFGSLADETSVQHLKEGSLPTLGEWTDFLKPDKKKIQVSAKLPVEDQIKLRSKLNDLYDSLLGGTNVGGSALQIARLASGSWLQAVVMISDGQSNLGSDDAVKEFLARVNNSRKKINVFTIGVGEYRQPVSIRIDDLQAPEVARPDDKFPVRVPVIGQGLPDEEFTVTLEMQRVKDKDGKATAGEPKYLLDPKRGKFKGGGDNPHDVVEFDIDIQDIKKVKADKDEGNVLEGTWQFIAKVPRHKNEAFPNEEHASDPPTQVLVQKRKLRVLLFAGGPTREYQFVRTLLYREVQEKRMELAVFLQTGGDDQVDQDVEKDWLLKHFPNRLGPDNPSDPHSSLNEYDVILAFDPDWTLLEPKQLQLLKEWVGNHAGGIVFIAGPVNTFHLARPGGLDLSSLLTIFPVVLKDSRLHSLGIEHDARRPYYLNFTPAARDYPFLKLDDEGTSPTAGWNRFFWRGQKPEGKDSIPVSGFHNYYPVEKLKPASIVIATFAGAASSRINDGKDEQPYIVSMPYGSGKTMYLSQGDFWRLRQFKLNYWERFWIKLARYAAAGTSMQTKYGFMPMGRYYTTGTVPIEAQIKGADLQALPRDVTPRVIVKRPEGFDPKIDPESPESFDLRPKNAQGEWNGWFVGSFKVRTPGEYEFKIPIPGTSDSLSHRIMVKKPNLELDNVRNNFRELYRLSSDAADVLKRLDPETRREVERVLKPPADQDLKDISPDADRAGTRLFFNLKDAGLITKCLVNELPKRENTKGQLVDLWDQGVSSDMGIIAQDLLIWFPAALAAVVFGVLLFVDKQVLAQLVFGPTALAFFAVKTATYWIELPDGVDLAGFAVGGVGLAVVVALLVLNRCYRPLVALMVLAIWVALVLAGEFIANLFGNPFLHEVWPWGMSYVLAGVVGILSLEWLTRKLLKLA